MRATRLDSLTGLRALAALAVFATHSRWLDDGFRIGGSGSKSIPLSHAIGQGMVGVSFFFILSGFVLAWSARPGDRPRRFFARRVARIYPAHLVTWLTWGILLVVGVVTASSYFYERVTPVGVVSSLLLVQAWFPNITEHFAMNSVSWSLSCEMFFYLCFPALIRPMSRLSRRGLWTLAAAMVGVNWTISLIMYAANRGNPVEPDFAGVGFWPYTFPPARLCEFVLGMALALLVARGDLQAVPRSLALGLAAAAYLVAGWMPIELETSSTTLVPFALLLVAYATADLAGQRSVFAHPVLVHLGVISYAFYLVHVQVISVIQSIVGVVPRSGPAALALVVVGLAASVGVAEVLFHVVERPAERWLRPRLQGRTPVRTG